MLKHIAGIIIRPSAGWDAIRRETMTSAGLLRTALILCLLPAIATAIGVGFFNSEWSPVHGYRLQSVPAWMTGTVNFGFAVVTLLMLALVFYWLAVPAGRARKPFVESLKVVVYGTAPVMLAGATLVLPVMVMVMLVAAIHTLYLLDLGLRRVLDVPDGESSMLLAMCVVLMSVAIGVIGAIASSVGLM